MMTNINALVEELTKRTEKGAVPWEETVQEDTFIATLKSASISIGLRNEVLTLEVRDIEGRLLERLSTDRPEPVQPSIWVSSNAEELAISNPLAEYLKRLHNAARRKALDADSKIESLLSELQAS